MISVERSFFEKFPRLAGGRARSFSQPVVQMLRKVACEQRINDTLAALSPLTGFDFVERALENFQISYRYAHNDRENIPVEGRVVIVANHPLGAFDALALLHLVGSVRRDVRMLANDVLGQIEALSALLLPINVFGGGGTSACRLREAYRALENEQALIIFPAGEVSRIGPQGVRDGNWSSGFVRMARQVGAPVLPVHVAASNSSTFYGVSMLARSLSSLLLAREMFGAMRTRPSIVVGELVASSELNTGSAEVVAQSMRQHVYQIGKHRPAVFATSRAIAHPESPLEVRRALRRAETIGTIGDGKAILLLDAEADCPALRDIGRLRELSFRRMGEGTGTRRDLDRFDFHYRHIVLWDDQALAIMGAYRLAEGAQVLQSQGMSGLYSSTLFDYAPQANQFLTQGVELGRSFVQPAYWNSRSLDYLWQGIGAYLSHRPHLRYMFGPVSISAKLQLAAREWIVHFHQHYFGDTEALGIARNVFQVSAPIAAAASELWKGRDAKTGMILLKQRLAQMDCTIPTLYKHYVDLCEPDGVRFLAFGIDPAFGNCVDGLIRLDLSLMRPGKRDRYLRRAIQTSYQAELEVGA
jgi:putative hemolysin